MTNKQFNSIWPDIKDKNIRVYYGYVKPVWISMIITGFKDYGKHGGISLYLNNTTETIQLRAIKQLKS